MSPQILRGSKQEIAEKIASFPGEIREAIIFVETPRDAAGNPDEDIFAEMEPFVARAGGAVDYSREAIYSRLDGE